MHEGTPEPAISSRSSATFSSGTETAVPLLEIRNGVLDSLSFWTIRAASSGFGFSPGKLLDPVREFGDRVLLG